MQDSGRGGKQDKAFKSIYLEFNINEDQFLSESGFDKFPGVAARWEVTGNDIYGASPAMDFTGIPIVLTAPSVECGTSTTISRASVCGSSSASSMSCTGPQGTPFSSSAASQ